jgi:CheY-like chemotaxis protein
MGDKREEEFVSQSEEFLEKAPNMSFDDVLMDIKLPGMSGIEAVRVLKANYPKAETTQMARDLLQLLKDKQ